MTLNIFEYNTSPMNKTLLIALFILGCVSLLSSCNEETNTTHTWTLQSQATATSLDFQELLVMAENIEVMSGGRFILKPVPGGVVTNGPDIFDAVKQGKVAMGNGWPNWWSAQHPAWAVMNAGPFDFMNLDASMMFFLSGKGTDLANELSGPEGVLWRPAWWPGMEFGLLSKVHIDGIRGMEKKKIRVGPGLPGELVSDAGKAYSIPLVPQEIKPALENDELDAVEWTTTGGAADLGLQGIAKFAIVPAIWQPSVLSDFIINEQAYNTLPADLQRILETAIHSYTLMTTTKSKLKDIRAFEEFKQSGTAFQRWSEEDLVKWRQSSDKLYEQYQQSNEFSNRLIEEKRAFKRDYNKYYEWFGPYE